MEAIIAEAIWVPPLRLREAIVADPFALWRIRLSLPNVSLAERGPFEISVPPVLARLIRMRVQQIEVWRPDGRGGPRRVPRIGLQDRVARALGDGPRRGLGARSAEVGAHLVAIRVWDAGKPTHGVGRAARRRLGRAARALRRT